MKRARALAKRRSRRTAVAPDRCVLDSGGLSALTGISARARTWLRWVIEHEGSVCVPTPVLVECTTGDGARDAEINRILGVLGKIGSVVQSPDERIARMAGGLRYRSRTDDGIDALVAAAALGNGSPAVLLTSDVSDLERLLRDEPSVLVQKV